jgi:hypothetical protein
MLRKSSPTLYLSVQVPPESVEVKISDAPELTTTASLVPSLEEVMARQFLSSPVLGVLSTQVPPESVEVQMFPSPTAASLVPSSEDAMPRQAFVPPMFVSPPVTSIQVTPQSVDVQTLPPTTTAASLSPSSEDVMLHHCFVAATELTSTHEANAGNENRAKSRTRNTRRRSIARPVVHRSGTVRRGPPATVRARHAQRRPPRLANSRRTRSPASWLICASAVRGYALQGDAARGGRQRWKRWRACVPHNEGCGVGVDACVPRRDAACAGRHRFVTSKRVLFSENVKRLEGPKRDFIGGGGNDAF